MLEYGEAGTAAAGSRNRVVFVLSGHGCQWEGMAVELLDRSPVFAERMRACEEALRPHVRWSLEDVLRRRPRARRLERVDVVQPALFAITISLAALWRECGVAPDAVVGHSHGEIAAAYLAGGLSLQDAAMVVARRSRVLAQLSGNGGMAALALSEDRAAELLRPHGGRLEIAAFNGPASTVVSGERPALDRLLADRPGGGIEARRVAIDYAAHSAQIEQVRDELIDALRDATPAQAGLVCFSTLTGERLDTTACDAEHWYAAERQPVRFEQAVRGLLDWGATTLLEVAPHPVLTAAMQQTVDERDDEREILVASSLRRGQGGPERFLAALSDVCAGGTQIDWELARRNLGIDEEPQRSHVPERASKRLDVRQAVLRELAAVLGGTDLQAGAERRRFGELGLDSSGVVELRNRLRTATGLPLATALLFDHPTPAALAQRLQHELDGNSPAETPSAASRRGGRAEEPLAIVGMSCRFPGGVSNPEELWELLVRERDAIGGLPIDRGWDLDRLYDPDPDRPGTSYAREGGFLYDAGDFDAQFFGISPREALAMDPQQRLFLEACWEALEAAGVDPQALGASATGVFAGINTLDYNPQAWLSPDGLEGYAMTGAFGSVIAGRVAYVLGLQGPALTVDTACSSSLVSLHLACSALQRGECSLALAGGVSVMATPGLFTAFSRQRALAADGRCKPFSRAADGTAWGEGVGVLALQTLSEARHEGRAVLALVRGSAVNQDGASNGLTAPNGLAQQEAIHQALLSADLSPQDIDAVEAHGTGTRLGDPIEAHALIAAYGQDRPSERPLWIGSLKSNVGHTQAAAGVAGVIKMVLAMRHGRLPRTLHVDEPSPEVDWSAGSVALLSEPVDWPDREGPRRAGVSSYGISGTNAHVILEEAPNLDEASESPMPGDASSAADPAAEAPPWTLSAKTAEALGAQAQRLERVLSADPTVRALDVGLSLARKPAFEQRAVLLGGGSPSGRDMEAMRNRLRALASGRQDPGIVLGAAQPGRPLALMFTGQGAQRPGMGAELYDTEPVFARALDEVCAHMDEHLELSLRDLVLDRASPDVLPETLDRTLYTQTSLFALEVALHRLVRSWGVEPAFLIGHSVGELAAACIAGVFSLADACSVVAARGRLMGELPQGGAMVAVQASEVEVRAALVGLEQSVALAAVNGPSSVVVSGDRDPVLRLAEGWRQEGRKTRELRVSHAFHSPRMEPMLAELRRVLEATRMHEPAIPIVSNLTGQAVRGELCDAEYWVRHVREPVRFADGVRWLAAQGIDTFLELGPDGVLSGMAQESVPASEGASESVLAVPALRKGRPERFALHEALARVWVRGCAVDWAAMHERLGSGLLPLPTYPFQRERYWIELDAGTGSPEALGQLSVEHPLLGAAVTVAEKGGWLFTMSLSSRSHPWLADHALLGSALLPGTALLELALAAGARAGCGQVQELTMQAPLALPEGKPVHVQVAVGEADPSGGRSLAIHSRQADLEDDPTAEDGWVCHATGSIAAQPSADPGAVLEGPWPPPGAAEVAVEEVHDRLAACGFEYGPAFQGLGGAWRVGEDLYAEAALAPSQQGERFALHPALFDSALHPLGASLGEDAGAGTWLPFAWSEVALHRAGASALRMRVSPLGAGRVSLTLWDGDGAPVASVGSLALRAAPAARLLQGGAAIGDSLFELAWEPIARGGRGTLSDYTPVLDCALDGAAAAALSCESRFPDVASLAAAVADKQDEAGPRLAFLDCTWGELRAPEQAHEAVNALVRTLQEWLAEERLSEWRLVALTRQAIAVEPGEQVGGLTAAPAWGLLRVAQAESPGRFAIVDVDDRPASWQALGEALASGEEQIAIRDGRSLVPRLARRRASAAPSGERALPGEGTILITGGTGGLGALLAEHLVTVHGARRLALASRRGIAAEGAQRLVDDLRAHGAAVAVHACDVSDREQLEALLAELPRPLEAVLHVAGALDDGVIEALTPQRVEKVFAPKLDGAWHLHELTRSEDLRHFVVFSSVAGIFGTPGQGNYAAANAFLDALIAHRRAQGLAGTSLAWGLWEDESGMGGRLDETSRARVARSGMVALQAHEGLQLFDLALAEQATAGQLVPVRLDRGAVRRAAREGTLAPVLRALAPASPAPGAASAQAQAGTLAERLAGASEAERERLALELVRAETAAVLGHASPQTVQTDLAFKQLGFDSLVGVELRNRLSASTGLSLPATLVFDHPSPAAVASLLLELLPGEQPVQGRKVNRSRVPTKVVDSEDPIAIIGMSCRYPGGVDSPEQLWRLVTEGRDAIGPFPDTRGWDLEGLYDPDPERAGTSSSREGGFLYDADEFDAEFFGISPREALAMDPQQRLLLEVGWEALERAGLAPESLRGSATGVFAGVMYSNYGERLSVGAAPADVEAYLGIGSSGSVASGRLAYTFGLHGPAVTVDTACSSSLVALHLACQALRSGECELALAGGATVLATPRPFVEFSRQRGLAPDGRCKSYADAADGVGWSEGVGLVVLERLSQARALGHEVHALIRSTAVNHDGASNGLTAPSGPAQQRVIEQALAEAGLSGMDVDAVEGHGTGTRLGDPIEAQALLACYGQDRPADRPLWLGSVKSNIGHTQAAAGVAGVIKMAMAMREGVLPGTLHVDRPSAQVDWSQGAVSLLTEQQPWPNGERVRRAGVSSFGVSGTNAHLILEQPPAIQAAPAAPQPSRTDDARAPERSLPLVWPLSGHGERGLRGQAQRLLGWLQESLEPDPADVGAALAGRQALSDRAVAIGADREQLEEGLRALSTGADRATVVAGRTTSGGLAYLFSGQGSQRVGMGAELHRKLPVFRDALDEVCAQLDPLLDRPLLEVMHDASSAQLLDQTVYTQAALFALEVSLFRLLESWGARPSFLLGHSIGELAAAHVAGVLTLTDACTLVAARGSLMQALPEGGAMVAVQAGEQEVLAELNGHADAVALAAINGPESVVLSGEAEAVLELAERWRERGRKVRRLTVSHAFHSPLMEPMLDDFRQVAQGLELGRPQIEIVSSVSGRIATQELCSPEYWVEQVRRPVRFADGLTALEQAGVDCMLELGPDPVLSAMAGEATVVASLLRDGRAEGDTAVRALAAAWTCGHGVDWTAVLGGPAGAASVRLPTYAFQRKRYWLDAPAAAGDPSAIGQAACEHPLLDAVVQLGDGQGLLFTGRLSTEAHPWLGDHGVLGEVLLPGTAFLELALYAGAEAGAGRVEELTIQAPLAFGEDGEVQLQVLVGAADEAGARSVEICSRPRPADPWTSHASGLLVASRGAEGHGGAAPAELLDGAWPPADADPISQEGMYERLARTGFEYGPGFRSAGEAWARGEEVFAEALAGSEAGLDTGAFGLHPALLDAVFHAMLAAEAAEAPRLPFSWRGVELFARGAASLRARLVLRAEHELSLTLADETGVLVAEIEAIDTRTASREQLARASADSRNALLTLAWEPRPAAAGGASAPVLGWLGREDDELARRLREAGVDLPAYADLDALGEAVEGGGSAPAVVLVACDPAPGDEPVSGAHATARRALELVQAWLADERLRSLRLAVVTRGALAARPTDEAVALAAAPVWGLVRSAQAESPDRFLLVDLDEEPASLGKLSASLDAAIAEGETQLALRDGTAHVPRLREAAARGESAGSAPEWGAQGTVLITGGTGGLGAALARHLVREHGVRHLLLVSRRGAKAPGARKLRSELQKLGASATLAACDVSDRERLRALLGRIDPEHPLRAVIHAAGASENALIESLTAEQLERVLAAKLDGAHNLHELTAAHALDAFVLISSMAGVFGGPGQANYAAANVFLDALAAQRRAQGLPASSLAWGLWSEIGMGSELDESAMARMAGTASLGSVSTEQALSLFDPALASGQALVLPARLDRAVLRAEAAAGRLPRLLLGLSGHRERVRSRSADSLARRLADAPAQERGALLTGAVRAEAAAVLGHASPTDVDPNAQFKALGFDSLAAVELRNRLATLTGLRLPATLAFDYPTVAALAGHLLELVGEAPAGDTPVRARPAAASARQRSEPIAIVGVGCRYPGAVASAQDLWELALGGGDVVGEFPRDRGWDLEALYDPDGERPGTTYTRNGGFLDDADRFDAGFFGIGPREALAMDPQQRLLLEASWEAFEEAGIDPLALAGSSTGVFAGVMTHDYAGGGLGTSATASLEGYLSTGTAGSAASGRIAYTFGLEGPAVTVDTACSSSLVALHLACQALRNGECSLALGGGASVMATPSLFVDFARQRALSADGRCKAFSADADGTGWSEGVGVLVLERLSDARRLGHPVLALIRGSAVNQDGASNGLTAPNGPSQQRLIAQALANADLVPQDIDAVEAHGTGTRLGDPIEAQALIAAYGGDRPEGRPLWVGSIKSNIGHTLAAAGAAGVIKMAMALRAQTLPRTIHAEAPSPEIDWSSGGIALLQESVPWPRGTRARRAAVSSFGISGTNAHLVMEEAPLQSEASATQARPGLPALPLLLSARNEQALAERATHLLERMSSSPALDPLDVGYSLATARAALEHRAAVVGQGREDLLEGLAALAAGRSDATTVEGRVRADGAVAFLFSGQGSQRAQMGRQLHEAFPAFAGALGELCGELSAHLPGPPLLDVLFAQPGSPQALLLDRTMYAQAGLFALEVALHRLLASWGVAPSLLLGHSIGELAAAHVAGVFSAEDACRLVAARGRLMDALPDGGAMVAVQASEQEVGEFLEGGEYDVDLAAVNGPRAVVLSGVEGEVSRVAEEWRERGRKVRRLNVSHAFHSRLMEPMLDELGELARSLELSEPSIAVVSNLTGQIAEPGLLSNPDYWVRQVRGTVRFADCVSALAHEGANHVVELGPDGVLSAMCRESLPEDSVTASALLREGRPEAHTLVQGVARLWSEGARVDWDALFAGSGAQRVALPRYPFQRERYWVAPQAPAASATPAGLRAAEHPLLGARVDVAGSGEALFTGRLSLEDQPWLSGHAVMDRVLLPGTAFVELAWHAAAAAGYELVEELTIEAPLVLEPGRALQLQVALEGQRPDGRRPISIHARVQDEEWVCHARGLLARDEQVPGDAARSEQSACAPAELLSGAWPPPDARPLDVDALYASLADGGLDYGEAFRGLVGAWSLDGDVLAEVALPIEGEGFHIHPALLDAGLHPIALLARAGDAGAQDVARLPFSWSRVRLLRRAGDALRVLLRPAGADACSLVLADGSGKLVAEVGSLALRPIPRERLGAADRVLLGLEWRAVDRQSVEASAPSAGPVVVLGAPDGWLARSLAGAGHEPRVHADVAALAAGLDGEGVETVLLDCGPSARAVEESTREALHWTLTALQAWLGEERLSGVRLVACTQQAVAAEDEDGVKDLAGAAVWGLVRSACSEHPGRFGLLDLDQEAASFKALAAGLLPQEPQLALRSGAPRVPRLELVPEQDAETQRLETGTVLITGGTGGLGALLAERLAEKHGARHLLLVSRGGAEAPHAQELAARLAELGAQVSLRSCDVSDREQLRELIESIPAERALRAVIHAAGAGEGALLEDLTSEHVERALAGKLDGAAHLDALTADLDLDAFVLISSMAGVFGGPGQGAYAAANAFLDGLAHSRRARGLPAVSMAWGLWQDVGLGRGMGAAEMRRMTGTSALQELSAAEGLELFDRALACERALVLPAHLERRVLDREARAGRLAPLLGDLSSVSQTPAATERARANAQPAAARLAAMGDVERRLAVEQLVMTEIASVLGHSSSQKVDPTSSFKRLGFDSLAAVELRNRLSAATGLRLAATIVFDHPTPNALVRSLLDELAEKHGDPAKASGRSPSAGRQAHAVSARRAGEVSEEEDPIAIVGIACRYPGGVRSAEELWQLLRSGRDGMSPFPRDRGWDVERLYDPDPDRPGTTYVREGGFLHDAALFDAGFFGISPREALATDPQQRLMLEVSWEALENAGIDPRSLAGSPAGVFTGVMYHDYASGLVGQDSGGLEGHLGAGTSASAASGRVSYTLGLEGPAVTVDTACSSSLVALHLACQALRAGECSLALAGGVTVLATPAAFVEFSRQRVLAPDGRCKAFSADADGTAWGEGIGLTVLERLSDARRAGHRPIALIRGSAVNQDGASNGLTAPNGPSQQRVIETALASAGLHAAEVDAVEAHGTGTRLGDPIEAQALLATYGSARSRERPLWLGSVKSNIGHTQAAAGVAGVIKMAMAMRHELLPRTVHLEEPSPEVDWSAGTVALLAEEMPWRAGGRPRRAAVSSFGISGTNAHLILEDAPVEDSAAGAAPAPAHDGDTPQSPSDGLVAGGALPWVLSAKGERALRAQAAQLVERLQGEPDLAPLDVAASLTRRAALEERAAVVGDREQALAALRALAEGGSHPAAVSGTRSGVGASRVVFVFPGHGSQWAGMAEQLLAGSPVFEQAVAECAQALDPFIDFSLEKLLRGESDPSALARIDVVQPVLFAMMVSLARLWRACGVEPDAVVGHSQGEIAAMCVAGALSLEHGARVVALRSKMLAAMTGRGRMASVGAGEQEVARRLERWGERIVIAAINGPGSVVVSGEPDCFEELLEECREQDVRVREIKGAVASGHSPQVEEIREELLDACREVVAGPTDVAFYSSVTGGVLDTAGLDGEYWYRNARQPVRFEEVVRALIADGHRTFAEVSPHPMMAVGLRETADSGPASGEVAIVGSLRRDEGSRERFLLSLGEAWAAGVDVDWRGLFARTGARHVALAAYPFQRERYWLEARSGVADAAALGQAHADHPILGAAVELADGSGWLLTGRLSLQTQPWLADHAFLGTVLVPGTCFLEMALHAARRAGCASVSELVIEVPLVIEQDEQLQVQVTVGSPDEQGRRPIAIHSRPTPSEEEQGGEWLRHASGELDQAGTSAVEQLAAAARDGMADAQAALASGAWPPAQAQPVDVDGLYDRLSELGIDYGPLFRGVRGAWRLGDLTLAEVALPDEELARGNAFNVHPALLDAAFHVTLDGGESAEPRMPFSWSGVALAARAGGRLRVGLRTLGADGAALLAADEHGSLVAVVRSVNARPLAADQLQATRKRAHRSLYRVEWESLAVPAVTEPRDERSIAVLGAPDGPLARVLRDAGIEVTAHAHVEAFGAEEIALPDAKAVLVDCMDCAGELGQATRSALDRVLGLMQEWLLDERLADKSLAVVTRGAVCADEDAQTAEGVCDLAGAAIWGLARSAQAEHPHRVLLLDVDRGRWPQSLRAALASGEPQLAIRDGRLLAPRLATVSAVGAPADAKLAGPSGTVLITGASGELGALVAEHLVRERGVRSLLLVSRRGERARGAGELVGRLRALGAEVQMAACDVADRQAMGELLGSLPADRPLRSVIHAAAVLDDATIGSLDAERIDRVLRAKVDGALCLHELTASLELDAFVMFSSIAGVMGSPGQGAYAAANCFLDALAEHRRSLGLAAQSIAWGLWEGAGEIADGAGRSALARMAAAGVGALSAQEGLELLDAAERMSSPTVVAVRLDRATLRAQARAGALPALLAGLVPARRQDVERGSLARRLQQAGEQERHGIVLELVREQTATVLGHASAGSVEVDGAFKELGFDSLTAVDLRNRLAAASGLTLPATLVFDYPTPRQLAERLHTLLGGQNGAAQEPDEERELRQALASIPLARLRQAGLLDELLTLASGDDAARTQEPEIDDSDAEQEIDSMDVDSLVRIALGGAGDEDGATAGSAK